MDGLVLRGDSVRLRQALLDFISNAIKFTDVGVVTVRAKALGTHDGTLLARFEVTDTGIGIDEAALPRWTSCGLLPHRHSAC